MTASTLREWPAGVVRTGGDGTPEPRWIHGVPPGEPRGPRLHAHEVDPDTWVLRQDKGVHAEAPFVYLLVGRDRALLLDTGAVADAEACPLRATVDAILADRTTTGGCPIELIVAHSHGHEDHVAGDAQLAGRPGTTVVPVGLDGVRAFFGLDPWPNGVATFDLGGRALEITGCPGHHEASIAVFDPRTGILLTGDTLYPGRLYAGDAGAFVASLDRLATFVADRTVTRILGGHVEMTQTPGRDHPLGALYQPDEPLLALEPLRLAAVRDAARAAADRPGVHRLDDVILYLGPCRRAILALLARGIAHRLRRAVTGTIRRRQPPARNQKA